MPEIDDLIRELEGPPPPEVALAAPRRTGWAWAALIAPLVVGVALMLTWQPHVVGLRGSAPAPTLDLRMIVSRDGHAFRVNEHSTYSVGERVYFRVGASPAMELSLWVDGPTGRETLARIQADHTPEDVRTDEGLLAWEFDRPGVYTFSVAPDEMDGCSDPACIQTRLEVQ